MQTRSRPSAATVGRVWLTTATVLLAIAAGSRPAGALAGDPSPLLSTAAERTLARAEEAIAAGDMRAAIDALGRAAASGDVLVPLDPPEPRIPDSGSAEPTPRRYVAAADRAAMLAATLPPAGLTLWRSRLDPLAKQDLAAAAAMTDPIRRRAALAALVERAVTSSVGREAALALGDLELEAGRLTRARTAYEQTHPGLRRPAATELSGPPGGPLWLAIPSDWLVPAAAADRPAGVGHGDEEDDQSGGAGTADEDAADDAVATGPPLTIVAEWRDRLATRLTEAVPSGRTVVCPGGERSELVDGLARLTLVSILERRRHRAAVELAILAAVAPEATGTLAGRSGRWTDLLAEMLAAGATWPDRPPGGEAIPSDRGQSDRPVGETVGPSRLWTIDRRPAGNDPLVPRRAGRDGRPGRVRPLFTSDPYVGRRDGDEVPLPLVTGEAVVWADTGGVYAAELATGRPIWPRGVPGPDDRPGDRGDGSGGSTPGRGAVRPAAAMRIFDADELTRGFTGSVVTDGASRPAVAATAELLLARVGDRVSWYRTRGPGRPRLPETAVVSLDRRREGALAGPPLTLPDPAARFEGTPVGDGRSVWTLVRDGETDSARSTLTVVRFDVLTGRRLWRRPLVIETMPQGFAGMIGAGRLRLNEGRLTVLTQAGAIVAVDADTGRPEWAVTYPAGAIPTGRRLIADRRDSEPIWGQRREASLTVEGGRVFAAPADSPRVFAVEASTGIVLWWDALSEATAVTRLLGVARFGDGPTADERPADGPGRRGSDDDPGDDRSGGTDLGDPARPEVLVATGGRVVFFDADRGRALAVWPSLADSAPTIVGRGWLTPAGVSVPLADRIVVFGPEWLTDRRLAPRIIREIALAPYGLAGGHLAGAVTAAGRRVLVVATAETIVGLDGGLIDEPEGKGR